MTSITGFWRVGGPAPGAANSNQWYGAGGPNFMRGPVWWRLLRAALCELTGGHVFKLTLGWHPESDAAHTCAFQCVRCKRFTGYRTTSYAEIMRELRCKAAAVEGVR